MKFLLPLFYLVLFLVCCTIGGIGYFEFTPPERTCIQCHEIRKSKDNWATSAHREVSCKACHGKSAESIAALQDNSKRVLHHITGNYTDEKHLSEEQIVRMNAACGACHASEYAHWKKSGHSASYATIFNDTQHNHVEQINPQCLWCHGMFHEGGVEQLIEPLTIKGPWHFKKPEIAERPSIACVSCHQVHVNGPTFASMRSTTNRPPATLRNSLAFYIRGEKKHLAANKLMVPRITEQGRAVKVSADPAHRMCVQCHSPNAQGMAGSSDDKTPTGIHEGLSCMACHNPHSGDTRNACVKCHTDRSNSCRRDVTTMDTIYRNKASKADVHRMTCATCHPNDAEARKRAASARNSGKNL